MGQNGLTEATRASASLSAASASSHRCSCGMRQRLVVKATAIDVSHPTRTTCSRACILCDISWKIEWRISIWDNSCNQLYWITSYSSYRIVWKRMRGLASIRIVLSCSVRDVTWPGRVCRRAGRGRSCGPAPNRRAADAAANTQYGITQSRYTEQEMSDMRVWQRTADGGVTLRDRPPVSLSGRKTDREMRT